MRASNRVPIVTLSVLFSLACTLQIHGQTIVIPTPAGEVTVNIPHADTSGSLVAPLSPQSADFRPPSIFSPPIARGSGARALGVAGAFTAVADDATAASWNPAGLIQLEKPEASFMFRETRVVQEHHLESESFSVGEDKFDDENLNYMSAVCPFRLGDRNFVCSLNYQEAYDFNQKFTADIRSTSSRSRPDRSTRVYTETVQEHVDNGIVEMNVISHLTTSRKRTLNQILSQELPSSLDFEQEGIIDAVTPALAAELTPKLSIGAAVNFYQDSPLPDRRMYSRILAKYSGWSGSEVSITDQLTTSGAYDYQGIAHLPPGGSIPIPIDVPFSGSGTIKPFSDTNVSTRTDQLNIEGEYEEINRFDDLSGVNATLGILWRASRFLSLGASVDLPWTAEATQTKTVRNHVTTYDQSNTRAVNVTETEEVVKKDVEFDFPLYWSVGALVKASDKLYTSLDVSQTRWSDFSFKAEGESRINPLDGAPYGQNEVDDCWSVRWGTEYLLVFPKTEIPLRGGLSWEQRPAVGNPDEYWGISVGSGVSLGKDPGKLIIDVAYSYTWANDVLESLVPDQKGLKTDVVERQVYVSGIWHF
jgi:long-subunit fatty acid transport protein